MKSINQGCDCWGDSGDGGVLETGDNARECGNNGGGVLGSSTLSDNGRHGENTVDSVKESGLGLVDGTTNRDIGDSQATGQRSDTTGNDVGKAGLVGGKFLWRSGACGCGTGGSA